MDQHALSFGSFRVLVPQRLLLEGDKPVRLGGRAFDILITLIERAGEVVSKEELIARAWPRTFVDETNLKIQVSALRRALGDGQGDNRFIATVVGQGYNFVAPIRKEEPSPSSPPRTDAPGAPHNLPFAATRMIGREEIATTLVTQLLHERLVTIVGPGGIGKTTLGLAVAERMTGAFQHGVWLIDLAPIREPGLMPSLVGTVLGLEPGTEDPVPRLVAALSDSQMLLVLDSCEHVIEAAATLTAAILRGTPGISILATSREPLSIQGEHMHRLGPLDSPTPSAAITAAESASFPAVRLFAERVTAVTEDFELTDANASLVAGICRRLDGLPLAIEFAAPRVAVVGIKGLAECLDRNLHVLGSPRRAADPRHRTMQAVVEWSYGLLSQDEQRLFRTLGIFRGGFRVEAAAAVYTTVAATSDAAAFEHLASLVAKSLVNADVSGQKPLFRLLDTIRAHALEKLDTGGERQRVAQLHAEYYLDLFRRASDETVTRTSADWLADHAGEVNNSRAALDWAFSPDGDESLAVALTVATIPLWLRLSMVDECRGRVEQALASLARGTLIDARDEMKLQSAMGTSLLFTKGAVPEAGQATAAALRLAEALGETEHQLKALWERWVHDINTGAFASALAVAQRYHNLALEHSDPATRPIRNRMMGMSYHYVGDQTSAWRHVEQLLIERADPRSRSPFTRFWFDQKIADRVLMARILWLRGFADRAWHTVRNAVDDAEALGDPGTLCYALCHGGVLMALWTGDIAASERYARMLFDQSKRYGFTVWNDFATRLRGVVRIQAGDLDGGSSLLGAGLGDVTDPGSSHWLLTALGQLVGAMGRVGRFAEALAMVESSIGQSQRNWLAPELLRIKGELLLSRGAAGGTEAAEDLFRQALNAARQQDSLSWELRAGTSAARLLRDHRRVSDAIGTLRPVYDRFTEGFDMADLVAAKQLLDELSVSSFN